MAQHLGNSVKLGFVDAAGNAFSGGGGDVDDVQTAERAATLIYEHCKKEFAAWHN